MSNNSAKFGGGIYSDNGAGSSKLNLLSSIVAKNTITSGGNGPDVDFPSGTITSYGHNLIGDGTDSALVNGPNGDQVGNAGTPIDPKLGSFGLNGGTTQNYYLQVGSPAISNGYCGGSGGILPAPVITTDQRNVSRTSPCDVGSFESRYSPIVVTSLNDVAGTCPGATNCTLRTALVFANLNTSATTITFGLSGTITVGSPLSFTNTIPVVIDGTGRSIIIDGGHTVEAFAIYAPAVAGLTNLTVQNSNDSAIGSSGTLALTGVTLTNNHASNGGGVNNSGTLTINNSVLSNNSASFNGGALQSNGSVTIIDSTITGNSAGYGGAGLSSTGTLTLINSVVSGNNGQSYPGGGVSNTGQLLVSNSTVSNNMAGDGGGIYSPNGNATVSNSTISGNSPNGIKMDSNLNLQSDIIAGNSSNVDIQPYNQYYLLTSLGDNLIGNGTGVIGLTNGVNGDQVGTSASPIDPKLATLANNGGSTQTMALLAGSPAIGYGNCGGNNTVTPNAPTVTTDQRGTARVNIGSGLGCDIGAFESGFPPNTATPTPTATRTGTATPTGSITSTGMYSTNTSTATPIATATQGATSTATSTSTTGPSATSTATNTPGCPFVLTPTKTTLPNVTPTVGFTPSYTPTIFGCPSPTPSNTVTSSSTVTASATPTASYTVTPTPSAIDTIGIYRGGTFYLRLHNSQGFADITIGFNPPGKNFPIVGDWTGIGYDAIGVLDRNTANFTLCTTYFNNACAAQLGFTLGNPNDTPLAGRWQISATHAGVGAYRTSNGVLYLKNALSTGFADYAMVMGLPGDLGIAGDWTGKGFDSPGIFRPGNSGFYLSNQVTNGAVFSDIQFTYGSATDLPIAGDWIAQHHDGIGMFRPTNGFVYLRNTLTTGFADNSFFYGLAGDVPIAGHWQVTYPPAPPVPVLTAKTVMPNQSGSGGSASAPSGNQIGG